MIFQDPYASLDPRQTVASILLEPQRIHRIGKPRTRRLRCMALLDAVGLNPRHLYRYPHEFSGGQPSTHRHRPRPGPGARPDRLRRTGQRPRRVDPGPGRQPARGAARALRPGLPVHRPRPSGGAPHLQTHRRHVPGPGGPKSRTATSYSKTPNIPTPRHCSPQYRTRTRLSSPPASASCCRVTCPPRPTRRQVAPSTPAAGTANGCPVIAAASRLRRSRRLPTAAAYPATCPATECASSSFASATSDLQRRPAELRGGVSRRSGDQRRFRHLARDS